MTAYMIGSGDVITISGAPGGVKKKAKITRGLDKTMASPDFQDFARSKVGDAKVGAEPGENREKVHHEYDFQNGRDVALEGAYGGIFGLSGLSFHTL